MSTQHTPGPWKVLEHSWSDTSIVAEGFDHGICLLDINHATEESQEADEALMAANARLIAAAPDLLEALQAADALMTELVRDAIEAEGYSGLQLDRMVEKGRQITKPDSPHGKVIAAIAKATGSAP